MKYKKRNLYTDANGRNIILRFENTDDQLRLDLHAVLNFIYDKCDNIDFNNEYILEKLINLKKEISIIISRFGHQKYEIYEPIEEM